MEFSVDGEKYRDAIRTMLELSADVQSDKVSGPQGVRGAVQLLSTLAGDRTSRTEQAFAKLATQVDQLKTITAEQIEYLADTIRSVITGYKDADARVAEYFKETDGE